MEKIASVHNERVQRVRALQNRSSTRREAHRFVIEGPHLVREAISAHNPIEEAFYTESFDGSEDGAALLDGLARQSVRLQPVTDAVMKSMCDMVTPQGIVAVAPIPDLEVEEHPRFVLVADAVGDPGNLGAIMRLAAGAGVSALYLMPGTADSTNPKVVRSAMGAHFRLPVRVSAWEDSRTWTRGLPVFLADSRSGTPYFKVDWTQPCALVVSSETHGPSRDAVRIASARVTIPMPGGIESLNVAMATAILIYEMVRQRLIRQEGNP